MKREFYEEMGVHGKSKTIIKTSIKDDLVPVDVIEISMTISARDGSNLLKLKSVLVKQAGTFNMPSRPRLDTSTGKNLSHLKDLKFEAIKVKDITLLIGCNVPKAHLYDAARVGGDDDPVAVRTQFVHLQSIKDALFNDDHQRSH